MQITCMQRRVSKDFETRNPNKKFRISWFVCSKQYTVVSGCIWKCSKYVSWNIGFDPGYFLSATGLAWEVTLKKTEVKFDFDMLLMVKKKVLEQYYQYAKANNKYMKDYGKYG